MNQFSIGFQYEAVQGIKLEASYVGNRTVDLQTNETFNTYDLAFRQKCNLMEGGITQLTRNDGGIWYNSLQVSVETRQRAGMNLIVTYTLSKMIEQFGFNDVQNSVVQRGLYTWDRPHRLTLGAVYQLPFGKGKHWLNTSHRLWSRVVSGWEANTIFQWQSGRPWDLPSNVQYVKEAKIPDIDWSAPRVRGVTPCVARWNYNGSITTQPFSAQYGCTDYNFLIVPRYAPRFTSLRDGRLRLHSVPVADLSLNKTTRITEKTSVQFRAEAFNVFNTYMFYNANFDNNPENTTFGTLDKATVAFGNSNYPRYVQLGVKFIW